MSAVDKYAQSNYLEANVSFKNYLKRFPDGFFALNAVHFAAESSRLENDIVNALMYYKKITQYPVNEYSANAWAWVLRITSQNKYFDLDLMQVSAENLLNLSSDAQLLREANVALMRARQSKGDLDVAQAYSKVVASDERNTPEIRVEARLNIARNSFSFWSIEISKIEDPQVENTSEALKKIKKMQEKAIKAYQVLKNSGPSSVQAEASYYLAYFLNYDQSFLASNEEIFWLIDNLPSQLDWRYKALITLAKNYAGLEDNFQAIYTLDFVISENYNVELIKEAKKIKEKLEAANKNQSSEIDSTVTKIGIMP
jgi:hypothetical protein